jgi:hypothetical protein
MPTPNERDQKRNRNGSRNGAKRNDEEPSVGDDNTPDLENDQADSGPDRDHKQLGG